MPRLLVVEDDAGTARMIKRGFEQAQFDVDIAENGRLGADMALGRPYSAIILDLMLPEMNGWEVCETLRDRRVQTPIIMLTARDAIDDRVRGLESGADDYLPKPFDFAELMARVRALLRRDRVHRVRVIRVADLEVDTAQRRAFRDGAEIPLSTREYDLLEALASHESQVLSREMIQRQVWMDEDSTSNTVDVFVGFLRRKLDDPYPVKLIHTIRGVGYTLRKPEDGSG
jgi:DNA-binding response OmpR family regulator